MRKALKTVTAALLLAALMVSLLAATVLAAGYPTTGTVTASSLNLRSTPSTNGSRVTTIPKGASVLVIGEEQGWYKICYKGKQGYVSPEYVSLSNTPVPTHKGTVSVKTSLYLRTVASTSATWVADMPNGSAVTVYSDDGTWAFIEYQGKTGFVILKYLKVDTEDDYSAGMTLYDQQKVGTVTATRLYLRSGPGTGYDALGYATNGSQIFLLGESEDWYYVKCADHLGYMSKDYVTITRLNDFQGGVVTTAGGSLNLRSGPGTEFARIGRVEANGAIDILSEESGWYYIRYLGKTGWASGEYIEVLDIALPNSLSCNFHEIDTLDTLRQKIVQYCRKFLGVKYVYGGSSPKGFDCSGLVQYVYAHFDIKLNRTASAQLKQGKSVSKSSLLPGDLVFFKDPDNPKKAAGHVGMYIGDGLFIHAPKPGDVVKISSLSESYYTKYYVGARRYVY